MTYDDQDDAKTESDGHLLRRDPTMQSAISELDGNNHLRRYGMTGSSGHYVNHSTIHLDGEKSLNDNSSLQHVSFFSVAEELLMKKNLMMGNGLYGGTSSQMTSQQDDKVEYESQ
jgi:hypothetical protein